MALTVRALTTVERVELDLRLGTGDAEALEPLIEEASAKIATACGREFFRLLGVVEAIPGFGTRLLRVKQHIPLVGPITSVVFDTDTIVDAGEYTIEDANLGWIRRIDSLWLNTARVTQDITRDPLPGTEDRLYVVTYSGGFLTPHQIDIGTIIASTAVVATPNGFDLNDNGANPDTIVRNDTDGSFVDDGYVVAGNVIVLGADDSADDGTFPLLGVTATTLTIATGTFTTGGLDQNAVSFTGTGVRDLPYEIERAAIDIAASLFRRRGRDATVRKKSLLRSSTEFGDISEIASFREVVAQYGLPGVR